MLLRPTRRMIHLHLSSRARRSAKLVIIVTPTLARTQKVPAMTKAATVSYKTDGPVAIVTIERPEARNAVNHATAQALAAAFRRFDADPASSVAILTGRDGAFCAGFDLKETASGSRRHRVA